MLPAACAVGAGGLTVVVVPLVSLRQRVARDIGRPDAVWQGRIRVLHPYQGLQPRIGVPQLDTLHIRADARLRRCQAGSHADRQRAAPGQYAT
jgi:hypothetical protein